MSNLNSTTSATLTGRQLVAATIKAPVPERAVLGGSLHLGLLNLERPTPAQAARLVKVSTYFVECAAKILNRPPLVRAVLSGRMSLHAAVAEAGFIQATQPILPQMPTLELPAPTKSSSLEEAVASASDAERSKPRSFRILVECGPRSSTRRLQHLNRNAASRPRRRVTRDLTRSDLRNR